MVIDTVVAIIFLGLIGCFMLIGSVYMTTDIIWSIKAHMSEKQKKKEGKND